MPQEQMQSKMIQKIEFSTSLDLQYVHKKNSLKRKLNWHIEGCGKSRPT